MIDPNYYGLVEILVGGVIVLGLAFWQLWGLRKLEKDRKEQAMKDRRDDDA